MSDINLSINKEVVEPIIRSKIQAAIIETLSTDSETIVEKIVEQALEMKVDDDGKVNSYSSYNKTPIIEWLCRDAIRKASIEALKQYLLDNRQTIKEAFIRKLSQRGHAGKLAEKIISSLSKGIESTWNWDMKVTFDPKTGKE